MNKLLTIVIPCYNTEQYISECLESILKTEYNDVLEILAINDGSKDKTLSILDKYEKEYPEILRVIDKPNGGWGSVINLAIKEASGLYFKILDSDDWFEEEAFNDFIKILSDCNADIFISNYTEHYTDRKIKGKPYHESLCGYILSLDKFFEKKQDLSLFPMTNITVRVDVLRKKDVILPPRYYGDICFFVYVNSFSNSVYVTNLNVYQYRKFVDGQSTSIAGYVRNFRDYIEVNRYLISFFSNISLTSYKKRIIKANLIKHLSFAYKLLMSKEYCGNLKESSTLLREFNTYLKKNSKELYRECFKITNKHIPYVLVWRLFNINLFKLR